MVPLLALAGVGESDLSLAKFRLYVKERSACMLRSGDRVPPGNPNNDYMADSLATLTTTSLRPVSRAFARLYSRGLYHHVMRLILNKSLGLRLRERKTL